jgi:hypothetical protein
MSLAEDVKLSAFERHPSLCLLFYFQHFCLPVKFGEAFFYAIPKLTRPLGFVFLVTLWTMSHFEFGGGVDVFCKYVL